MNRVDAKGKNIDLFIRRGRSVSFAVTVTGIDDWDDIEATFCFSRPGATPKEVECTITPEENKILVPLTPAVTQGLIDTYEQELIIHKDNWVKDVFWGKLYIGNVVKAVINEED